MLEICFELFSTAHEHHKHLLVGHHSHAHQPSGHVLSAHVDNWRGRDHQHCRSHSHRLWAVQVYADARRAWDMCSIEL